MTAKKSLKEEKEELGSSALKVNLERTAVTIEIPERYAPLLEVVAGHYVQVLYLQDNRLQSVCAYLQVKRR